MNKNSNEDLAWEKFINYLCEQSQEEALSADDCRRRWDSQPELLRFAKFVKKGLDSGDIKTDLFQCYLLSGIDSMINSAEKNT